MSNREYSALEYLDHLMSGQNAHADVEEPEIEEEVSEDEDDEEYDPEHDEETSDEEEEELDDDEELFISKDKKMSCVESHSSSPHFTVDGRSEATQWLPWQPAPQPRTLHHAPGGTLQRDAPFLLDLHNFPDLSNADINGQNPNIQVTIEVVDGLEGAEPEKEQHVENKPNWRNWWQRSSITARRPDNHDYPYDGNTDDSNFLKPLGDWERRETTGGTSKAQTEYDYIDGEGDWSSWSACSVSCGHGNQKRTRSCGYACTATESRTCDMPSCPGIEDAFKTAATEVSALAGTDGFNATELFGVDTDSCERWMNCKSEFLKKYMLKVATDLPSCPCSYPTEVAYSTADVQDPGTRRLFRWKDASGPKERLEIYKPTARYCVRSLLTMQSTTLASQHCCYDDVMRLITRGKGAGTPNLISTEFSADLHYKVDVLPWIICKGDWSRYQQARPPNNGQECTDSPPDEDYYKQFEEAREF
ncbi:hypothetical protein AAFF_G00116940 [Aldrovandia affinis]|uniref:AMOP domain-containing protein n=1 Tax=Aldrovandia affinis TaxID=143900 RepID=A0AAD7T2C8_9TELE|nr:hypothetical protein AAFF_G00116940 [Aldrovandia affinis]